ncbi:MAG TPA: hypothetical protein VD913_05060, partial [bacterium]|nr:hypothetical protein [bacterium]
AQTSTDAYRESYQSIRQSSEGLTQVTETDLERSRSFLTPQGNLKSVEERWANGVFGISEVYFLPPSSTRERMVNFQKALKERFKNKVYLVDEDKLHLTIQGLKELANHPRKEAIKPTEEPFASVIHRANQIETPALQMRVGKISWDPSIGIFWEVEPYLDDPAQDPLMKRRQAWGLSQPRPAHITAAYLTQPFSREELKDLKTLLAQYQFADDFGDINVSGAQIIAYEDLSFNAGYRVLTITPFRSEVRADEEGGKWEEDGNSEIEEMLNDVERILQESGPVRWKDIEMMEEVSDIQSRLSRTYRTLWALRYSDSASDLTPDQNEKVNRLLVRVKHMSDQSQARYEELYRRDARKKTIAKTFAVLLAGLIGLPLSYWLVANMTKRGQEENPLLQPVDEPRKALSDEKVAQILSSQFKSVLEDAEAKKIRVSHESVLEGIWWIRPGNILTGINENGEILRRQARPEEYIRQDPFQGRSDYLSLLGVLRFRASLGDAVRRGIARRLEPDPLVEIKEAENLLELLADPRKVTPEFVEKVRLDSFLMHMLQSINIIERVEHKGKNRLRTREEWVWALDRMEKGSIAGTTPLADGVAFYYPGVRLSLPDRPDSAVQKPIAYIRKLSADIKAGNADLDPSKEEGRTAIKKRIRDYLLTEYGIGFNPPRSEVRGNDEDDQSEERLRSTEEWIKDIREADPGMPKYRHMKKIDGNFKAPPLGVTRRLIGLAPANSIDKTALLMLSDWFEETGKQDNTYAPYRVWAYGV